MPKLTKRAGEKLDKDIYDAAGEDDRFAEVPDPGRGMTRASEDVMKRRKILKVSRRKFGGAGGGAGAPSAPAMPASKAAASSNPFAATTLAPPAAAPASTETGGGMPSKANPFANIAFASNATAAAPSAPKPTFSFGASGTTASAPKPATSTFSFGASTAKSQPGAAAAPPPSVLSTPKTSKGKKEKVRILNENLLHTIVNHWEGRHLFGKYDFLEEYQAHAERLESEETDDAGSKAASAAAPAPVSFGAAPSSSKGNAPPASTQFSFRAPAPSPAAKPFSMGAPAPAAGTFSFAAQISAAPAAAPTFSFGAASAASSAPPAPGGGSSNNNNDDDPTSNPDDGKIEQIEHEENTEEEVLYEARAKHVKFENHQWKKYGAGVLRLYRHKTTGKQRMVIRNEIGKVQFNVGVSKGMKFDKEVKKSKRGQAAYVKFYAVEDASKGMESFMLQVKPECVDKLHEALEGMVA